MAKKTNKKQSPLVTKSAKRAPLSSEKKVSKTKGKVIKEAKSLKKSDKKLSIKPEASKKISPKVVESEKSLKKVSVAIKVEDIVVSKTTLKESDSASVQKVKAPVKPLSKKEDKKPSKKSAGKKSKVADVDSGAKWGDLHEKYKQFKAVSYNMKDAYEANQPLMHKILGWGWILSSENDRLEVLFKDGKKILISNYKQ